MIESSFPENFGKNVENLGLNLIEISITGGK